MAVLYSKYRCKSSSNIFHHSIWCVVSFFRPPCNFVFYCCLAKDLLRGTPAVFPFDFSTGPLLIILHLSLAIACLVTSFIILVHLPHLLLIRHHFCQVICIREFGLSSKYLLWPWSYCMGVVKWSELNCSFVMNFMFAENKSWTPLLPK